MLKVIDLEQGFPTVEEARSRMLREVEAARRGGHRGVKLIHGYGSSGVGGNIRLAVGRVLTEMQHRGELALVIFGEDWSVSDQQAWTLIRKHPALKRDSDLNRRNPGITIVWF